MSPAAVVEEARDPESPLHHGFTWDDEIAAEAYRREQARALIQAIIFRDPDSGEEMGPVFVNVITSNEAVPQGHGYVTISAAMNSKPSRDQVLRAALSGLEAWRKRYGYLKEFEPLIRVADRLLASFRTRRRSRRSSAQEEARL